MSQILKVRYWTYHLKEEFMRLLGGKCQICGYDRCRAALVFHHTDPARKQRSKNHDSGWNRDPAYLKRLIDEGHIRLLCANCHAEVHYLWPKDNNDTGLLGVTWPPMGATTATGATLSVGKDGDYEAELVFPHKIALKARKEPGQQKLTGPVDKEGST